MPNAAEFRTAKVRHFSEVTKRLEDFFRKSQCQIPQITRFQDFCDYPTKNTMIVNAIYM